MKIYNVAVIGCGVIAPNHLYSIEKLEGLNLVAVCDNDEEKAKNTAEKYGVKYYTDYKKMAENEQLDGVHICLPHYLHKEVTVERRSIVLTKFFPSPYNHAVRIIKYFSAKSFTNSSPASFVLP